MSLWILQPDSNGNCCDCNGRTSPCDSCSSLCLCKIVMPQSNSYVSFSEAKDYLNLQSATIATSANKYFVGGGTSVYPATQVGVPTLSTTSNSFTLEYGATRNIITRTSLGLLNGQALSFSLSANGQIMNSASIALVDCEGNVAYYASDAGVTSISETMSSAVTGAKEYILTTSLSFSLLATPGAMNLQVSCPTAFQINPVVAAWEMTNGTTGYIEGSPKTILPPFGGAYYTNETTAQAAMDLRVSNCIGYFNGSFATSPTPSFSIDASAENIYIRNGKAGLLSTPSAAMLHGFTVDSSCTLTIGYSVEGSGSLNSVINKVSAAATLYNETGALISKSAIGDFPSNPSQNPTVGGTFSIPITEAGKYYLYCAIGNVTSIPQQSCEQVEGTFTVGYSTAKTVLNTQALYYTDFTCPGRLNC